MCKIAGSEGAHPERLKGEACLPPLKGLYKQGHDLKIAQPGLSWLNRIVDCSY
jgi:hypothetical protein